MKHDIEKLKKAAGIAGGIFGNIIIISFIYLIFFGLKYINGFENAVMFCLALIFFYIIKLRQNEKTT